MIGEPSLISSDPISRLELTLSDIQVRWSITLALLITSAILDFYSFGLIDRLQSFSTPPIGSFLVILTLILMFSDYIISHLLAARRNNHLDKIVIKHKLRNDPITLLEGADEHIQVINNTTAATRLGIGLTLLNAGSVTSLAETAFILVLSCNLIHIMPTVLYIILDPGRTVNPQIFSRSKDLKKVKELQTDEFFEEIQELRKRELISHNRTISGEKSLRSLLEANESATLEFKASMWTRYKTVNKIATDEVVINPKKGPNYKDPILEDEVLHTVASFLNTLGGTLLIGVKDKPTSWGSRPAEVFGIETDYNIMGGNKDGDDYVRSVYEVLNRGFQDKSKATTYVRVKIEQFDGKDVCRIDVMPLPRVKYGELYIKERSDPRNEERFYHRAGTSSLKLSISSSIGYIRDNFPPPNA